jgi:hypothetical protein
VINCAQSNSCVSKTVKSPVCGSLDCNEFQCQTKENHEWQIMGVGPLKFNNK